MQAQLSEGDIGSHAGTAVAFFALRVEPYIGFVAVLRAFGCDVFSYRRAKSLGIFDQKLARLRAKDLDGAKIAGGVSFLQSIDNLLVRRCERWSWLSGVRQRLDFSRFRQLLVRKAAVDLP